MGDNNVDERWPEYSIQSYQTPSRCRRPEIDQVPRFIASPESTDEICAAFRQLQAAESDVLDVTAVARVAGKDNRGSSNSTLTSEQFPSEMGQTEELLEQPPHGAASMSRWRQVEQPGITRDLLHLASGFVDDCPPKARSTACFLHDIDMMTGLDRGFELDGMPPIPKSVALDRDIVIPWANEARNATQHEMPIAMHSHDGSPDHDTSAIFDIEMSESTTLAAQRLQPFDNSGKPFSDN